jgi:hypothetical protein
MMGWLDGKGLEETVESFPASSVGGSMNRASYELPDAGQAYKVLLLRTQFSGVLLDGPDVPLPEVPLKWVASLRHQRAPSAPS